MAEVSPQTKTTRRRALGRKLIRHSSELRVLAASVRDSQDVNFLEAKEGEALGKLLKGLDSVAGGFDKIGTRLDKK